MCLAGGTNCRCFVSVVECVVVDGVPVKPVSMYCVGPSFPSVVEAAFIHTVRDVPSHS